MTSSLPFLCFVPGSRAAEHTQPAPPPGPSLQVPPCHGAGRWPTWRYKMSGGPDAVSPPGPHPAGRSRLSQLLYSRTRVERGPCGWRTPSSPLVPVVGRVPSSGDQNAVLSSRALSWDERPRLAGPVHPGPEPVTQMPGRRGSGGRLGGWALSRSARECGRGSRSCVATARALSVWAFTGQSAP